jgi:hypothetical protein
MGGLVTLCRQPQRSRVDDVSATTVGHALGLGD